MRRETDVRLWRSTATSLLFHSVAPAESITPGVRAPGQLHGMAKTVEISLLGIKQSDQVRFNRSRPWNLRE